MHFNRIKHMMRRAWPYAVFVLLVIAWSVGELSFRYERQQFEGRKEWIEATHTWKIAENWSDYAQPRIAAFEYGAIFAFFWSNFCALWAFIQGARARRTQKIIHLSLGFFFLLFAGVSGLVAALYAIPV